MSDFFIYKLEAALMNGKSFVLFRMPDENEVRLFVNDNSGVNRFLMHSFDSKTEKSITDSHPLSILQKDFMVDLKLKLPAAGNLNPIGQNEYQNFVSQSIDYIKSTNCSKIVGSRVKVIENQNYNLIHTYIELLKQHPSAFVYLWYEAEKSCWMGASPELLLMKKGDRLETVSLAGTKSPENEWTEKEIEEQKIVTDYIMDAMRDLPDLEKSETITVQAGKFQHLKNFISSSVTQDFKIDELLSELHPTPAVCGLPKKEAFDYIISNENYDRSFYTGYAGMETSDFKIYFVNLRCAEFFSDSIKIYVGGGITADSQPEKEWQETELKSGTIINALVK